MSKVTFHTATNPDGTETEWAVIDNGEQGTTAMLKAEYDKMIAGDGNTVSNA